MSVQLSLYGALALTLLWLPVSVWRLMQGRAARAALHADIATLQADRQLDLFRVARRDTLTGLNNRQAFMQTLSARLANGDRFAVLLIDLDNFGAIGDSHGQATGDEVLLCVAARLQAAGAERESAARFDGDRFALLLTDPAELDDLPGAAARIFATLSQPNAAAGQLVDAPVSIGIALAPDHGATMDTLLRAVQAALRHAKSTGGGTWHLCCQIQARTILARQHARQDLQDAIEAGQIVPWYQPIIELPGGQIAKFEVLARWLHPKLGVLLPDQFIPAADEYALSGQISMSLLRQVARDTRDWPTQYRFAINVSAGQVRELIGLINTQPGAWQRRMDLSRLDVEISEAALMRDRGLARELIDVLHEHGARAVLDDFGSGSSNFFHLRDMPFDSIKIGKVFIQTLIDDHRAEACVMAMLWLGHGLGMDIVADGVESQDVADRLGKLGCNYAQGFLYARPGDAAAAALLVGLQPDREAA